MSGRRIAFFADAGNRVGTGHLFRIQAIREALCRPRMNTVAFAPLPRSTLTALGLTDVRSVPASANAILRALLDEEPAVTVLDTYRYLNPLAAALKAHGVRVAVFDDHGRVKRQVDIIVNASPEAEKGSLRPLCRIALIGPRYAPLSRSFREARRRFRVRARIKRVLVALGGMDVRGQLGTLLAALRRAVPQGTTLEIVGTPAQRGASGPRWLSQRALASRAAQCDIAVLAGGTMLYQAAAVGLPVVCWPQTSHQLRHAMAWNHRGSVRIIRAPADVVEALMELLPDRTRIRLSRAARSRVDAKGADRIARALAHLARSSQ